MAAQHPESWCVILFTDMPPFAQWYKSFLNMQGHRLVSVVTSSKRDFPYLDVVRAVQPEVDILVSNHPRRWATQLASLRPDLLVSTVFPWRLPTDLLTLPRLGAVNVHPALLPHYRGTMTPYWLLRNGEHEAGLTLHRMAAQFDTGPILAQAPITIDDNDRLETLLQKFLGAMTPLWELALPRLARGDPGEPQDESQASYFGHIEDEAAWKSIDWTLPARTIHNIVRSSNWGKKQPPGAVGALNGVQHRITRTQLLPDTASDGLPGTVISRDSDTLLVQCGDGVLAVMEYEPAAMLAAR